MPTSLHVLLRSDRPDYIYSYNATITMAEMEIVINWMEIVINSFTIYESQIVDLKKVFLMFQTLQDVLTKQKTKK